MPRPARRLFQGVCARCLQVCAWCCIGYVASVPRAPVDRLAGDRLTVAQELADLPDRAPGRAEILSSLDLLGCQPVLAPAVPAVTNAIHQAEIPEGKTRMVSRSTFETAADARLDHLVGGPSPRARQRNPQATLS